MEKSTVEKFAELNLPIDLLLKQLPGIKKTLTEELLEEDKSALLNYLQVSSVASLIFWPFLPIACASWSSRVTTKSILFLSSSTIKNRCLIFLQVPSHL